MKSGDTVRFSEPGWGTEWATVEKVIGDGRVRLRFPSGGDMIVPTSTLIHEAPASSHADHEQRGML